MIELAFGIHQRPQAKAAAKTLVLSNVAARTIFCRFYSDDLFPGLSHMNPRNFPILFDVFPIPFPHVQHRFFRRFGIATTAIGIRGPRYHPDDPNIILSGGWDNTAAWIESMRGFWGDLSWDF